MAARFTVCLLSTVISSLYSLVVTDGYTGNTRHVTNRTFCPSLCICNDTEGIVDCSGTPVNVSIIQSIPEGTVVLNLSNTYIRQFGNQSLSRLFNLQVLDLANASLVSIKENIFRGLWNLKYLNISRNDNIPFTNNSTSTRLFEDLKTLEELRIYGTTTANLDYTYPVKTLGPLTSLTSLWIDGMNKKTFGPQLANLTKLSNLYFPGDRLGFGFCDIDTIYNSMFVSVTTITHLYIVQCGVQVIEENAFVTLTQLELVDLSGNVCLEMDGVSKAFQNINAETSKLTELVLNYIYDTTQHTCGTVLHNETINGIRKLPLKTLHLDSNAIVKVSSAAINTLPYTLTHLSARDNEFEPDMYMFYAKNLKNLEWLDVSYQFFPNKIWFQEKDIPNDFQKSVRLVGNRYSCRNKLSKHFTKRRINLGHGVIKRKRLDQEIRQSNDLREIQHNKDSDICPKPPYKIPPIIPFLPPKLNYLDVSNSKIDFPLYNFTVNETNTLKILNASKSILTCWGGPIYGLNKLEYLDLQHNMCERVGPYFFQEFNQLKHLLLGHNFLSSDIAKDINGRLFQNLNKLEFLDIEHNGLQHIPPNFLKSQSRLQTLNLRINQLSEFQVEISHMKNLFKLDLSNNSISTLSKSIRKDLDEIATSVYTLTNKSLKVNLSANSIHCYCVNIAFLRWLSVRSNNTHLQITVTDCIYEDNNHADISKRTSLDDAIVRLEKECASHLPLIIGVTFGVIVFTNIIVGVTVHYYRWKLRYWYYVSRVNVKVRSDGYRELQDSVGSENNRWKYDAYVAYADRERETEFVKEMIDYLENRESMRLCDSDRDFVPGQSDYRMICNAIHVSRISILIVTDKSTRDSRWEIAMHMCQEESLNRGKRAHFAIFLDGIPNCIAEHKKLVDLYDLVKANAYLEYPTGTKSNIIAGFWNKCVEKINRCGERFIQADN